MPARDEGDEPGLVDRFAAAYRGRHAAADALWWFRHPGTATPEGRSPPDAELPALKAQVYGRGADEAAVERYAALLADLEADRAAVMEALRAADGDAAAVDGPQS